MTSATAGIGTAVYEFLIEESAALDEHRYEDWLAMLTEDFVYEVPVARSREDPLAPPYDDELVLAHESKSFLEMRFNRVLSRQAWAERPIAFVRHFVSNVRVVAEKGNRVDVFSNVMVVRSRLPEPTSLSSAGRHDSLVRSGQTLRLAHRKVFLDTEVPTDAQLSGIY